MKSLTEKLHLAEDQDNQINESFTVDQYEPMRELFTEHEEDIRESISTFINKWQQREQDRNGISFNLDLSVKDVNMVADMVFFIHYEVLKKLDAGDVNGAFKYIKEYRGRLASCMEDADDYFEWHSMAMGQLLAGFAYKLYLNIFKTQTGIDLRARDQDWKRYHNQ